MQFDWSRPFKSNRVVDAKTLNSISSGFNVSLFMKYYIVDIDRGY